MNVRRANIGWGLVVLAGLTGACTGEISEPEALRTEQRDVATPLPPGTSVMGTEAWPSVPVSVVPVRTEGLRGELFGLTGIDHEPSEVEVRWKDDRFDLRLFVDSPDFSVMTGIRLEIEDDNALFVEDQPMTIPYDVTLNLRDEDIAEEEGGYAVGAVSCAGEGPGRSFTAEDGPDDLQLNFGTPREGYVPVDFVMTYNTRFATERGFEVRPEILEGRVHIPIEP